MAGNVIELEDNVHVGFDVKATNDNLHRLTQADEGTLASGSITNRRRNQVWTLTQVGNWDVEKLDLTGDNDYADAGEYQAKGDVQRRERRDRPRPGH